MVQAKSFRDLVVYQKSFDTALEIHKISLKLPNIEQYATSDQIRRASKSICANIAEGFGKQQTSSAEFKRFLALALGSSNEMLVWIDFIYRLEYIDKQKYEELADAYDHISKMLSKLRLSV